MSEFDTDIMIDLETASVSQNAAILQIGAVWFKPKTGDVVKECELLISLNKSIKAGFDVDADTIEFWMNQPKSVSSRVWSGIGGPRKTAKTFIDIVVNGPLPRVIWSNGLDFDLGILKNLYQRTGVEWPFTYNIGRDLRTRIEDVEFLTGRNLKSEVPFTRGSRHNALDDAKWQVEIVHQSEIILDRIRYEIKA